MAKQYVEHYGYIDDGHSLAHYGVPGMRWRHHTYRSRLDRIERSPRSFDTDSNNSGHLRSLYDLAKRSPRSLSDVARYERRQRRSYKPGTRDDASRAAYYAQQGKKRADVIQQDYDRYRNSVNARHEEEAERRRQDAQNRAINMVGGGWDTLTREARKRNRGRNR